jgi:hypothetical protein
MWEKSTDRKCNSEEIRKEEKEIFHFFVFFLSVVVDPYGGTALPSRLLCTTSTSPQCNAVQHTQLDTTESARFTRLE